MCPSLCVCASERVCVRLSLCLFVWPPASRNMRIGNYERYRCQLPASNERVRERERGGGGKTETDVRSSLWAGLSSFLLATFGIAHTPRVLPICNVACLSGPTAMALPCSMPHAPCTPLLLLLLLYAGNVLHCPALLSIDAVGMSFCLWGGYQAVR